MNRQQFLDLAESTRTANPTWFDLPQDDTPRPGQLNELETMLGATFPDDYRWFLEEFGGGDFAMARVYSADQSSDLYLAVNQPANLAGEFLAIADDGTGNLFGFPIRNGASRDEILIFDHEANEFSTIESDGFLTFLAREAFKATTR